MYALNVLTAWEAFTTARPIATHFSGHGCMFDLTPDFNFRHVVHWSLYNQALAVVRSTGAGIKYLYCTSNKSEEFRKSVRNMIRQV